MFVNNNLSPIAAAHLTKGESPSPAVAFSLNSDAAHDVMTTTCEANSAPKSTDKLMIVFIAHDQREQIPQGFGFRLGPGTNYTFLCYCTHYHNKMKESALTQSIPSTIELELSPFKEADSLIELGLISFLVRGFEPGLLKAGDLMTVQSTQVIDQSPIDVQVINVMLHLHSMTHQPIMGQLLQRDDHGHLVIVAEHRFNSSAGAEETIYVPPLIHHLNISADNPFIIRCTFKIAPAMPMT